MRLLRVLKLTAFAAVLTMSSLASAQDIPGFLEGPITDIDPVARTARVNGVLMSIPEGTPVSSPTVDLSALAASLGVDVLDLVTSSPLPGIAGPGFNGSTCLCETTVDPVTGAPTAVDMVLEPAENVVIGIVTEHSCVTGTCDPDDDAANSVRVSGMQLNYNADPRITSAPMTNRGFEVNLLGASMVGSVVSAEGYYALAAGAAEPQLHFYVVEVEGGELVNAGVTEVSVTRAQCRQRNGTAEWNVLGSTHDPADGTVTVRNGETLAVISTATSVADPEVPVFGDWQVDITVLDSCPATIVAEFNGAVTLADVDQRIDDPVLPPVDPPAPGGAADTLTITRAEFRQNQSQLRIGGTVVVSDGNEIPPFVTLFAPGTDDGADGCTGASIGDVEVDPVDLSFAFRDRNFPVNPGTVCAASTNGGSIEVTVVAR